MLYELVLIALSALAAGIAFFVLSKQTWADCLP